MSPLPSHFSSILLSNWQSAVAKVFDIPEPGKDATRTPHDIQSPHMIAATAAAAACDQDETAKREGVGPAAPTSDDHRDARFALDYALALIKRDAALAQAETREEMAKAEALLEEAKFGNLSPLWLSCVAEFYEHYKTTENAVVPYIKFSTLNDFVLPGILTSDCKIAVIGDWGTGETRAQDLLERIGADRPDVLIHLGDIYYSCTSAEANRFYENCIKVLGRDVPVFSLCGNHDMYSGAAPYYALLKRIGQPASFFCLKNNRWQIIAADTGYNDFKPLSQGADATWIRDKDEGDTYSEMDWHRDKFIHASGRKTILMTHHQLFTRNSSIHHDVSLYKHRQGSDGTRPVNDYLLDQFGEFLSQIDLWIWGHEHNQVIYKPFAGLKRGRCVGASAIPVPVSTPLYTVSDQLQGQAVPELMDGDRTVMELQPDGENAFYRLGYAMLTLSGERGTAEYFQFDPVSKTSTLMFMEEI